MRRPQEHAYWTGEQQAVPLWFRRGSQTIGYGYARMGTEAFWFPQECMLGPIGARTSVDATACVLAAVRWGRRQAKPLRINVPGLHPCLAPLLEARFRILYVETHLSSQNMPVFDPRCYVTSGSDPL